MMIVNRSRATGKCGGFQALIIANWMPWSLRLPHMLEILADEYVYAWALALLLGVKQALRPQSGACHRDLRCEPCLWGQSSMPVASICLTGNALWRMSILQEEMQRAMCI